jgi:hypothetical protein
VFFAGIYRVQPANCTDTGYTNTCAKGEQDCPTGEQPNSDLSACAVNATDVSVSPTRPGKKVRLFAPFSF